MLNDWSDRERPPPWKSALARAEAGLVGTLLAIAVVYGIVSEIRTW
jgi:hypothetical protein